MEAPSHPYKYEYLVATGSNLGDRAANIANAETGLAARCGRVLRRASLHETAPVGGVADLPFLNGALVLGSDVEADDLMVELLALEKALGRVRGERWSNRTIDLDILLWRESQKPLTSPTRTFRSQTLEIPHPRLAERLFVLQPAAEIARDWVHPALKRTLGTLLSALSADRT